MRILLMSDTHHDTNRIDDVLEACGTVDQIIHCGDVQRDREYLEFVAPPLVPILAVCGNNEWYAEIPYHTVVSFEGIQFYITHGFQEGVKRDLSRLAAHAKKNGCQVALFGHTHTRTDETIDGIRLINPGSVCYPGCSYAILTLCGTELTVEFFSIK